MGQSTGASLFQALLQPSTVPSLVLTSTWTALTLLLTLQARPQASCAVVVPGSRLLGHGPLSRHPGKSTESRPLRVTMHNKSSLCGGSDMQRCQ